MAITSHGRYCITGIVQYRICLHDDLKWNFLNISHSGTGANLMWTSYPIFGGAMSEDHTVAFVCSFARFARANEGMTSYGVLLALDSVPVHQAVTSNAWRQSCTGSRLLVGGAGGGAGGGTIHCTAACRSETLRSYATKPGHGPGTTNQPVENILHNFGVLSFVECYLCSKLHQNNS